MHLERPHLNLKASYEVSYYGPRGLIWRMDLNRPLTDLNRPLIDFQRLLLNMIRSHMDLSEVLSVVRIFKYIGTNATDFFI